MADWITQAGPDGFAKDIIGDIDDPHRTQASFERTEFHALMGACVRNSKSIPYPSSPLLPKKLKAPRNKMPEEIYGKGNVIQDFYGDDER